MRNARTTAGQRFLRGRLFKMFTRAAQMPPSCTRRATVARPTSSPILNREGGLANIARKYYPGHVRYHHVLRVIEVDEKETRRNGDKPIHVCVSILLGRDFACGRTLQTVVWKGGTTKSGTLMARQAQKTNGGRDKLTETRYQKVLPRFEFLGRIARNGGCRENTRRTRSALHPLYCMRTAPEI